VGMDVCLLCVLLGRGLRRADHSSMRSHTDSDASLCVIKKPRGRGGHSPRWAAEPEMIMMMMMIIITKEIVSLPIIII
jgi:hypothetical protein